MHWLEWVGSILQISGGAAAIWGLHQSKRDLFPDSGGLHLFAKPRRFARRLKVRLGTAVTAIRNRSRRMIGALVRRVRPHREDVSVVVPTGTIHAHASIGPVVTVTAKGYKRYTVPEVDASAECLNEFLVLEFENIHNQIQKQSNRHDEDLKAVRERIAESEARLDVKIDTTAKQLRQQLPETVGGKDGRGFELAAIGVALAIAGTIASGFAPSDTSAPIGGDNDPTAVVEADPRLVSAPRSSMCSH